MAIEEGYKEDLEEDGYKLKDAKNKYYFGGKNADYIFFAIKRDDEKGESISRAVALDLESKIKIESIETKNKILTINDYLEINTENAILLDGKKTLDWSELAKKDTIIAISKNIYLYANKYVSESEIDTEKSNLKKKDNLYYISAITYSSNATNVRFTSSERTTSYPCTADLKNFSIGDLVIITVEDGIVTKLAKATSKDYDALELGRELVLDYKDLTYSQGMIGKYYIDSNTQIYVVNKRYKNNSNTEYGKCTLEEATVEELQYIKDEVINVIVQKGEIAKTIYIERETNKFSLFYGRVKDVYIDKSKLKITVSPVDTSIKKYEIIRTINCEIGDIISYTLEGKEGEEIITIDEVYRSSVIGYKGDLIVESIENGEVYLTNGEHFNKSNSVIELNGKNYKLSNYVVLNTKVRKDGDRWVFSSATFDYIKSIKFAPGDRIAIDELEGVIVVYSGYTD